MGNVSLTNKEKSGAQGVIWENRNVVYHLNKTVLQFLNKPIFDCYNTKLVAN